MNYYFQRSYRGPVKGVVLDWAGTTVDFGCFAPAGVFKQVFKDEGVEITDPEARGPMGLNKRDHIRTISKMPRVAAEWMAIKKTECTEADIDRLFENFIPRQLEIIPRYAQLVPDVLDAQRYLRENSIKIGTTTGYNKEMMDLLVPLAAKQGYKPDSVICANDVPAGRPAPWMAIKSAMDMQMYPLEALIKIGDTISDIEEGLNAGMWSVGVVMSSNELGLSLKQIDDMEETELNGRCAAVRKKMLEAGAHFVIDTLNEMPQLIERVQQRLAQGLKP